MATYFGEIEFTIPYSSPESGITQSYLNDLDYTNNTGYTTFTGTTYFLGIGQSKISELKKYGQNSYTGITITSEYTGYTIDNVSYRDFPDGYTLLTGNTVNFTKEEVFERMLTRNEHFLGFVEQPTIYSDVYVERGKQGVMEVNFRLGEVDNMGELSVYGNGYFKVKKQ